METFKQLGINKDLVKGLTELNIVQPSRIQQEVIPLLLNNQTDLIGQAQTGTGKTAAYGLPLLHQINAKEAKIQGLILCPTRELSQQVAKQLFRFTKYTEKVFAEAVYGGAPIDKQIAALRRPTHIIVVTPGRLIDLVHKKAIELKSVRTIILDEADEMLSMGFKQELNKVLGFIPETANRWLFSATMPEGIKQIVNQHLSSNAQRVVIEKKSVVNQNINHQYAVCEESDKLQSLLNFLRIQDTNRGIIFCKTKVVAQKLAKQLIAKNVATDSLHGDLKQKERDKVMRAFKNESLQFLVATDIAARGIDIEDLAFVFHYQLPDKDEYYTHRSGRTARAGKEGLSLCLITSSERKQLQYFEKALSIQFSEIR